MERLPQMTYRLIDISHEVLSENARQFEKWGAQDHGIHTWNTILSEEVGEVSNAILETERGNDTRSHIREELIQVAAVATSIVEWMDRSC